MILLETSCKNEEKIAPVYTYHLYIYVYPGNYRTWINISSINSTALSPEPPASLSPEGPTYFRAGAVYGFQLPSLSGVQTLALDVVTLGYSGIEWRVRAFRFRFDSTIQPQVLWPFPADHHLPLELMGHLRR